MWTAVKPLWRASSSEVRVQTHWWPEDKSQSICLFLQSHWRYCLWWQHTIQGDGHQHNKYYLRFIITMMIFVYPENQICPFSGPFSERSHYMAWPWLSLTQGLRRMVSSEPCHGWIQEKRYVIKTVTDEPCQQNPYSRPNLVDTKQQPITRHWLRPRILLSCRLCLYQLIRPTSAFSAHLVIWKMLLLV